MRSSFEAQPAVLLNFCIIVALGLVSPAFKEKTPARRIVFDSTRNGLHEIYVMDADGSNQRRLTHGSGTGSVEAFPAWSPDRARIAFTSMSNEKGQHRSEIRVISADGTGARALTRTPGGWSSWNPSWSPDGKQIAFASDRDDTWDVYIMHADGSNVRRITRTPERRRHSWNPAWSPDGRTIAFDSDRTGRDEIYVVDVTSMDVRALTHTAGTGKGSWTPQWSPDGTRIVFGSNRDGSSTDLDDSSQYEIYVMNADGSTVRRLTRNGKSDARPRWSPDGRRVVFQSNRDGSNEDIYVMDADGSAVNRLTANQGENRHPAW